MRTSLAMQVVLIAFLAGLALSSASAWASPFDCAHNKCGITLDAPYPNLVVGTIDGIATPSQTRVIFETAQKDGRWRLFPKDSKVFLATIQPVSISVGAGKSITVLAALKEVRWSWLAVGQLVRFAPHRGLHEKPRPRDPYWVGIGCVLLLCPSHDDGCFAHFRSGIYRLKNGEELNAAGTVAVPGGAFVDPLSSRLLQRNN